MQDKADPSKSKCKDHNLVSFKRNQHVIFFKDDQNFAVMQVGILISNKRWYDKNDV